MMGLGLGLGHTNQPPIIEIYKQRNRYIDVIYV